MSKDLLKEGWVERETDSLKTRKFFEDGLLKLEEVYAKNGRLMSKKFFFPKLDNVVCLVEDYDIDGQLDVRGRVNKNKEWEGLFEIYHQDQIHSKLNFKGGKLHGKSMQFFNNGQLSSIENYKEGKLHGISDLFYGEDGARIRKFYKNGKLKVTYSFFYSSNKKGVLVKKNEK